MEGSRTVEGFGFGHDSHPRRSSRRCRQGLGHLPDHDVNTYVVADVFARIQAMAALPALQTAISAHRADIEPSRRVSTC